ncbi:MAG: PQQ-binding-like beta-propeller repeat protein [bacterium]
MEFLRYICSILLVALLLSGCTARFYKFPEPGLSEPGLFQSRGNPGGNAQFDGNTDLPDTMLFERRLNGGIGAQIVGNDLVVVVPTFNKRIYFLAATDGRVVSTLKTESAVGGAVAIVDELMYYAEQAGGDRLTCFNLVSGKQVWQAEVFDPSGAPVVADADLFIAGRDGTVFRLDRWTGRQIWKTEDESQIYTTVVADAEHVYYGNAAGELVCLARESGDELWRVATGGAIVASPMVADRLYCGSADGTMYALDRKSGQIVWSLETAGQIFTTPVLQGNRLFFGSHDRLVYCVDVTRGGLLWSYDVGAVMTSSPIGVNRHFICASAAGEIFAFTDEGELIGTLQTKEAIVAPLAFINGRLYVGTDSRRIYCFGSSS